MPRIQTTVVGSYPLPDWLAAAPSEQALADAMRVVIHTQERAGIDPVQLYISIAGESYFYLSNRYTLAQIFKRDLMSKSALTARARHNATMILNAVRR